MGKKSDFNQIMAGPRLSISWSAWWLSKSFNHPKKRFHFPFVFLILSDFEVSSSEPAETPCLTSVKLPQGFPLLLVLLVAQCSLQTPEGLPLQSKFDRSAQPMMLWHTSSEESSRLQEMWSSYHQHWVQFNLWCIKMQTEWCGYKNRCINHIEPQKMLLKLKLKQVEIIKLICTSIYCWSSSNWDKNCKTGMAGSGCQAMVVVRGKALLVRLDQPGVGATTFERLGNNQNQNIFQDIIVICICQRLLADFDTKEKQL